MSVLAAVGICNDAHLRLCCSNSTDQTHLHPAQGVASFMEYKCVEAVFPEMNGAALFQLSVTPMGAPVSCAGAAAVLHGPSSRRCQGSRERCVCWYKPAAGSHCLRSCLRSSVVRRGQIPGFHMTPVVRYCWHLRYRRLHVVAFFETYLEPKPSP